MARDVATAETRVKLFTLGQVDLVFILITFLLLIIINGDYTSMRYIATYLHGLHILLAIIAIVSKFFDALTPLFGTVLLLGFMSAGLDFGIIIYRGRSLILAFNPIDIVLLFPDIIFLIFSFIYLSVISWFRRSAKGNTQNESGFYGESSIQTALLQASGQARKRK